LDMPTVGKRNAAELGRAGSMWSSLTVAWSGLVPLSTTLNVFERLTCIILQLSCVFLFFDLQCFNHGFKHRSVQLRSALSNCHPVHSAQTQTFERFLNTF
jgi:hypothetical protein